MTASGGFFQIRPQKDFRPERGRNNVLSLGLLSDLPEEVLDLSSRDTPTEPKNAYEFMHRRKNTEGDPTLRRWNASVRMSNFATLDMSPFAVGLAELFLRERFYGPPGPLAGFYRCIARPPHQGASTWRFRTRGHQRA